MKILKVVPIMCAVAILIIHTTYLIDTVIRDAMTIVSIRPGQIWCIDTEDPFREEREVCVTILETKKGWVRYQYKSIAIDTMKEGVFVQVYKLKKESSDEHRRNDERGTD
jgi:hypothetical protein